MLAQNIWIQVLMQAI